MYDFAAIFGQYCTTLQLYCTEIFVASTFTFVLSLIGSTFCPGLRHQATPLYSCSFPTGKYFKRSLSRRPAWLSRYVELRTLTVRPELRAQDLFRFRRPTSKSESLQFDSEGTGWMPVRAKGVLLFSQSVQSLVFRTYLIWAKPFACVREKYLRAVLHSGTRRRRGSGFVFFGNPDSCKSYHQFHQEKQSNWH